MQSPGGICRVVSFPHLTLVPRMGTNLPPGLVVGGVGDREQCSCQGDATSPLPDVWSILERWAGRKDFSLLASSAVFLSWLQGCISAMGRGE